MKRRRLPFKRDDKYGNTRTRAYELVGWLPGKAELTREGRVRIGELERDDSRVVQVGRLAMQVVDWWEEEPLTAETAEPVRIPTGIADARGPEALGNTDCGV